MGDVTRVAVATGTNREAAILGGSGWTVIAGGGDEAALGRRLREAAEGAGGILSFGMAGALAEGLCVGDWVVGDRLTGAVEATCDSAWRDALAAALPGARVGVVYADGRLIAVATEKRAIGQRCGALAGDMESHVAAAVAREQRLPLAIVRCVSDEIERELPPAVIVAMRPDGKVDVRAMLRSLAAQPGQGLALIQTAIGFTRAMRSLKRSATALQAGSLLLGTRIARSPPPLPNGDPPLFSR